MERPDLLKSGSEETQAGDDRADAVIAADDTGLVGGEHDIVDAEIESALEELG